MPYRRTARKSKLHTVVAPAALLALMLGGCAADNPMRGALRDSIGSPFGGPTEQGFHSLVRKHCGDQFVGGQTVATLLGSDTTFRQLTGRLYRGDISNDAFMNLLLQEYPAADANIPTTGCIVRQLNTCFNTSCDGRPAEPADAIAAQDIDTARQQNLDELPAADPEAVEAMIEGDSGAGIDDIGPLPSQDPGVLTGTAQAERAEPIPAPSQP